MPEGPEIATSANVLKPALIGIYIVEFKLSTRSVKWNLQDVPKYTQITQVWSHGKKIIFSLSNGGYIVTSYGMTGKWLFRERNHTHIVMHLARKMGSDNGKLRLYVNLPPIYFDHSRPMGGVHYLPDELSYNAHMSKVGICLLSNNITLEQYSEIICNPKYKNWQICKFLLKQEILAGVGNYLKAEILYAAQIRPDRVLSCLSQQDIAFLHYFTYKIMYDSYQAGGFTMKDFISPDDQPGRYVCQIYGNDFDKYGNRVIKSEFKDGRSSSWVPEVQK